MSKNCNCGHGCISDTCNLCDTKCRTIPELPEYSGSLNEEDRIAIFLQGNTDNPAGTYQVTVSKMIATFGVANKTTETMTLGNVKSQIINELDIVSGALWAQMRVLNSDVDLTSLISAYTVTSLTDIGTKVATLDASSIGPRIMTDGTTAYYTKGQSTDIVSANDEIVRMILLTTHTTNQSNPHNVTLQQAADALYSVDSTAKVSIQNVMYYGTDTTDVSKRYALMGDIASAIAAIPSGLNYKGMIKYAADTIANRTTYIDPIATSGDKCYIEADNKVYSWNGSTWTDTGLTSEEGDLWFIDYFYGAYDGSTYEGVASQIVCNTAGTPGTFDLFVDKTFIPDGSITVSKLGPDVTNLLDKPSIVEVDPITADIYTDKPIGTMNFYALYRGIETLLTISATTTVGIYTKYSISNMPTTLNSIVLR